MLDKIRQIVKETTMTESEVVENLQSQAKRGLPLNLQFFAEPGGEETPPEGESDGEETPPTEDETFTQSEVDSQISTAVNTALENRDKKHKKEMQQAIDDAIKEKERLAKLSEKERKDEELTQREKDIAKRLADIERKELKQDAIFDLSEKGLPTSFADFLLADNAENTLTNINEFKQAFDAAIEDAVKEKLKGTPPRKNTGSNGITKEQIMSEKNAVKRIKMIQENQNLFK